MSLTQRVTSIEGHDLEPSQHGFPNDNLFGTQKSLRRIISYDAFPQPLDTSQATHPTGGVAAYKVSTAKRLGEYKPLLPQI